MFDVEELNFSTMSESDVREIVVRPFLHELGYRHNTKNDIRTGRLFKYEEKFLGRPISGRGVDIRGFADYECIAGAFGKFVVEAKAPNVALGEVEAYQGHSYASHPEVAAFHFLLTNGREFKLFATSNPDVPVLQWQIEQTGSVLEEAKNYLAPDAIARRARMDRFEPGRPLCRGLGPVATIKTGNIIYRRNETDSALIRQFIGVIDGRQEGIDSGTVGRDAGNLIVAKLDIATPISALIGIRDNAETAALIFSSAAEYVSIDPAIPTLFQGYNEGSEDLGLHRIPALAKSVLVSFEYTSITEAIGYFDDGVFSGTFDVSWKYKIGQATIRAFRQILPMMALPERFTMSGAGEFKLALR